MHNPNTNEEDQFGLIIPSPIIPQEESDYYYYSSLEDRREINDDNLAPPNNIKNEENVIQPSNAQKQFNRSTTLNSSKNKGKYSCDSRFFNLKKDSEQNNFLEMPRGCSLDIEDRNDESNQVSEPKLNKDDHNQNPPSQKQKEKTPNPKFNVYKPYQYKKEEGKKGLRNRIFKFSVKNLINTFENIYQKNFGEEKIKFMLLILNSLVQELQKKMIKNSGK